MDFCQCRKVFPLSLANIEHVHSAEPVQLRRASFASAVDSAAPSVFLRLILGARMRLFSAGRGCMPYLAWKFQVDLLPNGEEHEPDRNPYRNLEESVKRY